MIKSILAILAEKSFERTRWESVIFIVFILQDVSIFTKAIVDLLKKALAFEIHLLLVVFDIITVATEWVLLTSEFRIIYAFTL